MSFRPWFSLFFKNYVVPIVTDSLKQLSVLTGGVLTSHDSVTEVYKLAWGVTSRVAQKFFPLHFSF